MAMDGDKDDGDGNVIVGTLVLMSWKARYHSHTNI